MASRARYRSLILSAAVDFAFLVPTSLMAVTFTVNNTGDLPDGNPGNGVCGTDTVTPFHGPCTLRAAIMEMNVRTIGGATVSDKISFSVASTTPASQLPQITLPVTIDGTTAPGGRFEIIGTSLSGTESGLVFAITCSGLCAGPGGVVKGLAIHGAPGNGMEFTGDVGYTIQNNFIGTNVTGSTLGLGNKESGIYFNAAGSLTTPSSITANVVVSNGADQGVGFNPIDAGIKLFGSTISYVTLQANMVGTNAAGLSGLGNIGHGIWIADSANHITLSGANIVAGNGNGGSKGHGIYIDGNIGPAPDLNNISGNFIGANTLAILTGNGGDGIRIYKGTNTSILANAILGSNGNGITFDSFLGPADATVVQQNLIGLNATGSLIQGNLGDGIQLLNSSFLTIGGSAGPLHNTISKNSGAGVRIKHGNGGSAHDNKIAANFIGTDPTGTTGNRSVTGNGAGIVLGDPADSSNEGDIYNNQIGGVSTAGFCDQGCNTIWFNNGAAIIVGSAAASGPGFNFAPNQIKGNSIWENHGGSPGTETSIDLAGDGITANDALDPDQGPNNLQNYPIGLVAVPGAGNVTITGTFNSQASGSYYIEFFASPTGGSLTSHREGQKFIGSTTIPTDGSGNGIINVTLSHAVPGSGEYFTATVSAVSPAGLVDGTSEFSPATPITTPVELQSFQVD